MQDPIHPTSAIPEQESGNPVNEEPISPASIAEETDLLKQELQAQSDKYLRLFAELDNFKKRSDRERIELRKTASRDIIVSLLEVLDDCDRAEKQIRASEGASEVTDGALLVFQKFRQVLTRNGLSTMESIGTPFDVEKHEAITQIEVPEASKGLVVEELTKGYYLNDKLIRFAKVVVGK